jgi:hypothetical protein
LAISPYSWTDEPEILMIKRVSVLSNLGIMSSRWLVRSCYQTRCATQSASSLSD